MESSLTQKQLPEPASKLESRIVMINGCWQRCFMRPKTYKFCAVQTAGQAMY